MSRVSRHVIQVKYACFFSSQNVFRISHRLVTLIEIIEGPPQRRVERNKKRGQQVTSVEAFEALVFINTRAEILDNGVITRPAQLLGHTDTLQGRHLCANRCRTRT